MILSFDKKINQNQKMRSPSAINGKTFQKFNYYTKRITSQRITSALSATNMQSIQSIDNTKFHSRNSIKNTPHPHLKFNNNKNNKTIDIICNNINSRMIQFSPLVKSPSNITIRRNKKLSIFRGGDKCQEEEKKIQSVLSELLIWDNKQYIENNESFKEARIVCEKEKERLNIQKKYAEKNQQFNEKKIRVVFE